MRPGFVPNPSAFGSADALAATEAHCRPPTGPAARIAGSPPLPEVYAAAQGLVLKVNNQGLQPYFGGLCRRSQFIHLIPNTWVESLRMPLWRQVRAGSLLRSIFRQHWRDGQGKRTLLRLFRFLLPSFLTSPCGFPLHPARSGGMLWTQQPDGRDDCA